MKFKKLYSLEYHKMNGFVKAVAFMEYNEAELTNCNPACLFHRDSCLIPTGAAIARNVLHTLWIQWDRICGVMMT